MIERHIDYLQFQCSINQKDCIDNGFEQTNPIQYYSEGFRDAFGSRYYFGNNKSKKCLCVMAGTSLEKQRAWGKNDHDILGWAFNFDAKVSRLDLAITEWVSEDLILVGDVKQWYEDGVISSPLVAHGANFISGYTQDKEERPETFYIGNWEKRGKRGIFRAYDKGLQLKIGDYMVTRLELEERGENAHNSAKRLLETDNLSGVFRSRFDVKADNFERIMDSPAIEVHRGSGKFKSEKDDEMTKRFEWLMSQVAPALKEFVDYEASQDVNMSRVGQFLAAAGVYGHTKRIAEHLANEKYNDKLMANELVPRKAGESE